MTEHDILHERLCAYALGELEDPDRTRLERDLATSAELRERLAEVERTIGFVRGAYAGEERLSDAALEELLERAGRDAGPAPARRLRLVPLRSPALRAAAAVLLLVGGVIGALAVQRTHFSGAPDVATGPAGDMALAKLERPQRAKEGGEKLDELRSIGYVNTPEDPKATAERNGGRADGQNMLATSKAPSGYVPFDVEEQEVAHVKSYTWRDTAVSGGGGKDDNADVKQRAEEPAVQTGSDDFFLGHGERRQGDAAGTYRGPGDSVAPGRASSAGAASPSVASSAPPTSPAALDPNRYPVGRYATADRPEPAEGVLERLSGLGYLGSDEGASASDNADRAVDRWMGGEAAEPAPVDRERLYEREVERLLQYCRPLPNERPAAMYFRFWGDHGFEWTRLDALSTFSVDVDTASYALARNYLRQGHLPDKAAVRTEEFLNYFDADLAPPAEGDFAIHTELAPSLFGGAPDRWMLRVGIRGRDVAATERKPLVLTFVVDTSGSMQSENRLELVKHALRLLVGELDGRDSVAVVAYSNEARLVLPMTSAAQRGLIESALHPLLPNGSTNAEAGLRMGYELALTALSAEANNRVVFLSDGVANVGQVDQDRINDEVARHRAQGIYLNTIGVGMGNHNDVFLEQLADKGDGVCDYVDSPEAARRAIVDRFTGAFETIASDVKVQVEFDPSQVERYRLLGYENRAIADRDFRNDAVDAGEVGAGHQVVALYELERTGATSGAPLATVHLRWKQPKGVRQDPLEARVTEIEHSIGFREAAGSYGATSPGYRRSVLVAQFAEVLRRSTHARGDSYERLVEEARRLEDELRDPDFVEFRGLVERARDLILAEVGRRTDLERALDDYRALQIERCLRRELDRRESEAELQELLEREAALVARIRELVRARVFDGR